MFCQAVPLPPYVGKKGNAKATTTLQRISYNAKRNLCHYITLVPFSFGMLPAYVYSCIYDKCTITSERVRNTL